MYSYANGCLEEKQGDMVREFPLVLHVNGRELATLITSPHDLRFLAAGFLRNQGFVDTAADFDLLAVCDDYGIATARIKRELPERLKPILTSGCGAGITFTLDVMGADRLLDEWCQVAPAAVFRLMDELARRAEQYRNHGGIHSAAVGDADGNLLLFAEDIGRHNTLDRLAGEAMFKGIDLAGLILVTSGRVSTEMAVKCRRLGISLIASRTSATDLAIKACADAGVALIGYVRGGKFTVYTGHERLRIDEEKAGERTLELPQRSALPSGKLPGITGVILAGGQSTRMGSNKALLPYKGGRFIEAIYRQLAELFPEVLVVTNTPESYEFLPCSKVPDIYPGMGALAGIHAGLYHSSHSAAFVVACDMPYLNTGLIRYLADMADPAGVLIPESPVGLEPLHAIYGKGCIPAIEAALGAGQRRIVSFFGQSLVHRVDVDQVAFFDPEFASFRNINSPTDYYQLRDGERSPAQPAGTAQTELAAGAD
jgi:FdhD protein